MLGDGFGNIWDCYSEEEKKILIKYGIRSNSLLGTSFFVPFLNLVKELRMKGILENNDS